MLNKEARPGEIETISVGECGGETAWDVLAMLSVETIRSQLEPARSSRCRIQVNPRSPRTEINYVLAARSTLLSERQMQLLGGNR